MNAQTTIKGKVLDAQSKKPLVFVNVALLPITGVGSVTNNEGYFEIQNTKPVDSIRFSFVGYETFTLSLKDFKANNSVIYLKESSFGLNEVVIKAGENPAHILLKQFWENRDKLNKSSLDAYAYLAYTQISLSASDIGDNFAFGLFKKPISQFSDQIDSSGEITKRALPFFLSESLSDYYYNKKPKLTKEVITSSVVKGIGVEDGTFISQILGSSFQDYNFYDNKVFMVEKDFISPLSSSAIFYYKFSLTDSLMDSTYGKQYLITFKPKRFGEPVFTGSLWMNESDNGVTKLDVTLDGSAGLSLINYFRIYQELKPTENGIYLPSHVQYQVDLKPVSKNKFGVFGSYFFTATNPVINDIKPVSFFTPPIEYLPTTKMVAIERMDNIRPDTIKQLTSAKFELVDSISQHPTIRSYEKAIKFLITDGYIRGDKIDFGPYIFAYGNNPIEGHRIRMGYRTTKALSDKWFSRGYAAYGFNDEKFKFGVVLERHLNRQKWAKFGFQAKYDLVGLGALDIYNYEYYLADLSTQNGLFSRMSLTQLGRLWYEQDLRKDLNFRTSFTYTNFDPRGNYIFAWKSGAGANDGVASRFTTTELAFHFRYSPGIVWLTNDNDRVNVGALSKPEFKLNLTFGFRDVLNSNFNYQKINLSVGQKVNLGYFGRGEYFINSNAVFGTIPYPILNIVQGNGSPIYSYYGFNTMGFFEFVTDKSVNATYKHRFDGLFLNKVPLIKKLKWNEVAQVSAAWGSMSRSNLNLLPEQDIFGNATTDFQVLDPNKPYAEVSYGLENIFKFFGVQVFHRLAYLDTPGANPLAVKVSFRVPL